MVCMGTSSLYKLIQRRQPVQGLVTFLGKTCTISYMSRNSPGPHRPRSRLPIPDWYVFTLIVTGVLAPPLTATASPWVLKQGDIVVVGTGAYQQANEEYLDLRALGESRTFFDDANIVNRRGSRHLPLNGQYRAAEANVTIRAGFTDRLEIELRLPFRLVSYTSDPAILLQSGEDSNATFQAAQEANLNFLRHQPGWPTSKWRRGTVSCAPGWPSQQKFVSPAHQDTTPRPEHSVTDRPMLLSFWRRRQPS